MGWISDRHMRQGGSIGGRSGKHKGPLVEIDHIIIAGAHEMFGSDLVKMKCGHEGLSYGGKRARCAECGKTDPRFSQKWGSHE